jgi:hypothetical protein
MTQSRYDEDDDVRDQLREALIRILIDKIRRDKYPSVTMMNMVESSLDERALRRYAAVLLDKIEDDQYPSIDMLKRVQALT